MLFYWEVNHSKADWNSDSDMERLYCYDFFLSAATRKHAAAREVFQKIPPDSIDVIHKQWEITVGLCQIAAYCY